MLPQLLNAYQEDDAIQVNRTRALLKVFSIAPEF